MPPVLGPVSPSNTALWSHANGMCATWCPSVNAIALVSRPTSLSSMTTVLPDGAQLAIDHQRPQRRDRLVARLRHDRALAGRQTVRLHDDVARVRLDVTRAASKSSKRTLVPIGIA